MQFFNKKSKPKTLEQAKQQMRESALQGKKTAKQALDLLEKVIAQANISLQKEIKQIQEEKTNTANTKEKLTKQLSKMQVNLRKLPKELQNNIMEHSEDKFTITLFGRTMAGKSTLMEILTQGDGNSIGKGSQRTTRDIRKYYYKGLEIYDVPGIGASDSDGRKDEEIAFQNAQKADLVLFLISNDAARDTETSWLSKVIALGKPVISIINIKEALHNGTKLGLFYKKLEEKINSKEIKDFIKQMREYGVKHGQNWNNVKYVYAHLLSAFRSRQKEFAKDSKELWRVSRFGYLEHAIVDEIIKNGTFYKLKSYMDSVNVPLIELFNTLFRYSVENSEQGRILTKKQQEFNKVIQTFKDNGETEINSFLEQIRRELTEEVSAFAEDNYNEENATENWREIVKKKKIGQRTKKILKKLEADCKYHLEEIKREIKSELTFSLQDFSIGNLNMETIWNTKRFGKILTVIGTVLCFIPGVNLFVGIATSLFGGLWTWLDDDREVKAASARRKLEKKLNKQIEKSILQLKNKMRDYFYGHLVREILESACHSLYVMVGRIYTLSNIQHKLATQLNAKLKENNKILLKNILSYLDDEKSLKIVKEVIREPGYSMMLLLKDGAKFPEETKLRIIDLMKERVYFAFDNQNLFSLVRQALGVHCDKDKIDIQKIKGEPKIVHLNIPLEKLHEDTKQRIPLAQQLTELLIMK